MTFVLVTLLFMTATGFYANASPSPRPFHERCEELAEPDHVLGCEEILYRAETGLKNGLVQATSISRHPGELVEFDRHVKQYIHDYCRTDTCLLRAVESYSNDLWAYERSTPVDALGQDLQQIIIDENAKASVAETGLEEPSKTDNQLFILMLWCIPIGLIVLVLLAATNQVVVFYDYADAWWSIAPLAFLVTGHIIAGTLTPPEAEAGKTLMEMAVYGIFAVLAAISVWINYSNAIRYNRGPVVGMVMGTIKLLVGPLMTITFLGSLRRVFDPKLSRQQNLAALFIVFVVGILWVILINGKRVYEKRGWSLADGQGQHPAAGTSNASEETVTVRKIA